MKKIAVIVVPYELGRLRQGVGRGPEHLLNHGAEAALATNGARVHTRLVKIEDRFAATGLGEADAGFEIMRHVADAVRKAIEAGEFPIVLAGSCFSAVGVVAGLNETAPGIVWFDAHSDFSEPATSESGYLDSMGLSIVTGSAWQAMHSSIPFARAVPESAVVLAGARSFDPCEADRIKASDIVHLAPDRLRSPEALLDAIHGIRPQVSGFYVHIDLDVIDGGVNVYSVPGGLGGGELERLLASLLKSFPVRAVTLSAYDPDYDPESHVAKIAVHLLETVAASV
jgi:arginase